MFDPILKSGWEARVGGRAPTGADRQARALYAATIVHNSTFTNPVLERLPMRSSPKNG